MYSVHPHFKAQNTSKLFFSTCIAIPKVPRAAVLGGLACTLSTPNQCLLLEWVYPYSTGIINPFTPNGSDLTQDMVHTRSRNGQNTVCNTEHCQNTIKLILKLLSLEAYWKLFENSLAFNFKKIKILATYTPVTQLGNYAHKQAKIKLCLLVELMIF